MRHRAAFFFLAILLPIAVFAADLRVQDQQGLIRAVRSLKTDKAQVEIKTAEQGPGELSLQPQSGIGLSKTAKRSGGQTYNFSDVQAGTWQIQGGAQVLEVRVKE